MKASDIVRSLRGHDAGGLFFILDIDGEYVILADGRRRRVETPKRKKRKHVEFVASPDARAAGKIRAGEKVTNNELRRALADFALRCADPADPGAEPGGESV
ncbi:MAG: KOW domain-containing RNA-binding protein [Oscillospiraceae bacterium]|jgi:ribosomal protein L14E/L6E/L27E|nr:KOW domain-containing RNA-binding protein [Oscillospiraceae bacterium]